MVIEANQARRHLYFGRYVRHIEYLIYANFELLLHLLVIQKVVCASPQLTCMLTKKLTSSGKRIPAAAENGQSTPVRSSSIPITHSSSVEIKQSEKISRSLTLRSLIECSSGEFADIGAAYFEALDGDARKDPCYLINECVPTLAQILRDEHFQRRTNSRRETLEKLASEEAQEKERLRQEAVAKLKRLRSSKSGEIERQPSRTETLLKKKSSDKLENQLQRGDTIQPASRNASIRNNIKERSPKVKPGVLSKAVPEQAPPVEQAQPTSPVKEDQPNEEALPVKVAQPSEEAPPVKGAEESPAHEDDQSSAHHQERVVRLPEKIPPSRPSLRRSSEELEKSEVRNETPKKDIGTATGVTPSPAQEMTEPPSVPSGREPTDIPRSEQEGGGEKNTTDDDRSDKGRSDGTEPKSEVKEGETPEDQAEQASPGSGAKLSEVLPEGNGKKEAAEKGKQAKKADASSEDKLSKTKQLSKTIPKAELKSPLTAVSPRRSLVKLPPLRVKGSSATLTKSKKVDEGRRSSDAIKDGQRPSSTAKVTSTGRAKASADIEPDKPNGSRQDVKSAMKAKPPPALPSIKPRKAGGTSESKKPKEEVHAKKDEAPPPPEGKSPSAEIVQEEELTEETPVDKVANDNAMQVENSTAAVEDTEKKVPEDNNDSPPPSEKSPEKLSSKGSSFELVDLNPTSQVSAHQPADNTATKSIAAAARSLHRIGSVGSIKKIQNEILPILRRNSRTNRLVLDDPEEHLYGGQISKTQKDRLTEKMNRLPELLKQYHSEREVRTMHNLFSATMRMLPFSMTYFFFPSGARKTILLLPLTTCSIFYKRRRFFNLL